MISRPGRALGAAWDRRVAAAYVEIGRWAYPVEVVGFLRERYEDAPTIGELKNNILPRLMKAGQIQYGKTGLHKIKVAA